MNQDWIKLMKNIFKRTPTAVLTMKITRADGTEEFVKAPVTVQRTGSKLSNFLKGIING
jgi:hypothetical protein